MATIQGIYIALFSRPADPIGLNYYNQVTSNGQNLDAIRGIAGEPEYLDRFQGQNNAQIVTTIFNDLFGRNPDLAALSFYVARLESGEQNIETIAINILDGARGTDLELVNAKIAAANQFTAAVAADPDALAAYQGDPGIAFGQAYLDQIDSPDDKLTDAQVQAQVQAFGDGEASIPGLPGTPGSILTLTDGADVVSTTATSAQFQSTANDDTIRAIASDSLGTDDVINGGAGFDTLNISDGALDGTPAPVISNVERINNSDNGTGGFFGSASTLNLGNVSGLQQLWSVGSGGANRFNYTNASLDTVFGASGGTTGVTVDINVAASTAGNSDTLKLAVDDNNASAVTFISTDDAGSIEAISLAALGASGTTGADAAADAVNLNAFVNIEALTVTGAGNIAVTADGSDLATFNAGAATGAVTLNLSAAADEDTTIALGSGADTLNATAATGDLTVTAGAGADTINTGAGDDTVVGGAGNDTINGGAGDDTITGGAGVDQLTGGAGADTFVYAAQSESVYTNFDTITDFASGTDTLDFSALNLGGATGTVSAGSTTNTTIGQFAGGVVDFFNVGGEDRAVGSFYDGTNTYVFADVNGNGDFDAGADLVVQLTGNVAINANDVAFA